MAIDYAVFTHASAAADDQQKDKPLRRRAVGRSASRKAPRLEIKRMRPACAKSVSMRRRVQAAAHHHRRWPHHRELCVVEQSAGEVTSDE
jgi:hypothetical protein